MGKCKRRSPLSSNSDFAPCVVRIYIDSEKKNPKKKVLFKINAIKIGAGGGVGKNQREREPVIVGGSPQIG